MPASPWFKPVRDWTVDLVRQPSVTNTPGETAFGPWLHARLAQWPAFRQHPERLCLLKTLDDPHERYSVIAVARGRGRRAVALCGHYDTVEYDPYGELAGLATDPEALLPRLIERLAHSPEPRDQRAAAELQSGDFLAGRGALDMKSGLAMGLAVLEAFLAQPDPVGNLIFVATPDEEDASHGMRSAVRQLDALLPEWGLEIIAALNVDSGVGEGEDGRAAFLGSVGKVLPSVFVVGRPTHAGAPFDGLNAALVAATMTQRMEGNPALGDTPGAAPEVAPPPMTLYQTDRRSRYNVTSPATAWCSYNVLTYHRAPGEILAGVLGEARGALEEAVTLTRTRAAAYARVAGAIIDVYDWQPIALDYATLRKQAEARGPEARATLAALETALDAEPGLDVIGYTQRLVEGVAAVAGLHGPAAVLCFASQFYPRVALPEDGRGWHLRAALEAEATRLEREGGPRVRLRPCFPGISDMSFFAPLGEADIDAVVANTPAWRARLAHDFGAAARLRAPIVNLGPWGSDYHQLAERVNAPYSFGALPELLWRVVLRLLSTPAAPEPGTHHS